MNAHGVHEHLLESNARASRVDTFRGARRGSAFLVDTTVGEDVSLTTILRIVAEKICSRSRADSDLRRCIVFAFRKFDHNGDGKIQRSEFGNTMRVQFGLKLNENILERLFRMLNASGSGYITRKEFIDGFLQMQSSGNTGTRAQLNQHALVSGGLIEVRVAVDSQTRDSGAWMASEVSTTGHRTIHDRLREENCGLGGAAEKPMHAEMLRAGERECAGMGVVDKLLHSNHTRSTIRAANVDQGRRNSGYLVQEEVGTDVNLRQLLLIIGEKICRRGRNDTDVRRPMLKAFQQFDHNGDGKISIGEFAQTLRAFFSLKVGQASKISSCDPAPTQSPSHSRPRHARTTTRTHKGWGRSEHTATKQSQTLARTCST